MTVALETEAMLDVLRERHRQIVVEGFDDAHDDNQNRSGQLAEAAAYYALWSPMAVDLPPWPWKISQCKPRDHRSNLVRAAALLLAEIDRIDRRDEGRPLPLPDEAPPMGM